MRVDHIEFPGAVDLIVDWTKMSPGRGRYVCAANVHMTMEAYDDPAYRRMINAADLVLPDGVPLVWALRALGLPQQRRIRVTPDILLTLFAICETGGLKVGLYGSTPRTVDAFLAFLREATPDLEVAFSHSPPFRPLTESEDREITEQIDHSGVQLLLVGLGCPKQEKWMADHAGRLHCVMFGVGAAFEMFAGNTRNAPEWMRDRGLEWLFRLASEPRRLWRRHVRNDPRFLLLLCRQVLHMRRRARLSSV
jgi:N-acetylglucosaminyldiphosphoundecaprenol N-acetyl-beta-D-mannosaminyltransferase